MSDRLTLYFSVENGGDGSAYPRFFDTEELAEWHQEHLDEGWGESCTGEVVVKGDNLSCSELQTREGYYIDLVHDQFTEDDEREINEFRDKFFPDGLPEFTIRIADDHHYDVCVDGRCVYKWFAYPEKKANQEGAARVAGIVNS